MAKKKPAQNFTLGDADVQAILCALPLVLEFSADSPKQDLLNESCCISAAAKMVAHAADFSANEVRVISFALTAAILLLAGKGDDLFPDIDKEWKTDLSRHFFSLNRLDPIFQDILDRFHN